MSEQDNREMHPHTRASDPALLKVSREIPLIWLVGIIAAGFGQAAIIYFNQQRQGELLVEIRAENRAATQDLGAKVTQLSNDIGVKNLKDVEHDLNIADLQRRTLALEATRRSR